MSKSELKAEKSAKKRKLSEAEIEPEMDNGAVAQKKAKKDKSSSGDKKKDKKSKKDKEGRRKSRKEVKAEQAEELNAAAYDVEDRAMEEAVRGEPEEEEEVTRKDKKEKKSKKEGKEDKKSSSKKDKKEKKEKKGKASKSASKSEPSKEEQTSGGDAAADAEAEDLDGEGEKKQPKKDKKAKKAKKEQQEDSNGAERVGDQQTEDAEAADEANAKPAKDNRFICFIGRSTPLPPGPSRSMQYPNFSTPTTGNLPYTATKADIEAHFSALHPSSVRLLTERDNPTKSRGIAFVEFGHFSHMKTCLAKFHHTEFTDARGQTRRINVELTAGGGGRKDARMDKVRERNQRLNEERARRIAKEEADKEEKSAGARAKAGQQEGEKKKKVEDNREEQFVHPSRRAHVPGRRS